MRGNLSNYVCKYCGGELLIDEEYHQKNYQDPSYMPLKDLSVYCENEEDCGEAGQFGEIAISCKVWEARQQKKEPPDESK